MINPIISDPELRSSLDKEGVASTYFAGQDVIDQLKDSFDRLHPEMNEVMKTGYYFSIYGDGSAYRKAVFDTFLPLLKTHVDTIFENYKILAIIAQVKGVGSNSAVNIHQDLSVVDEDKYRSYTLWIPLENSTTENGALSFLEGSQDAVRSIRAHSIGYLFEEVEDQIHTNSKLYTTAKGDALIFDAATLHFSGINNSGKPRLSIAVSIVEKDADVEIFQYNRFKPFDGTLDRYSVPDDFWLLYEDFEKERLLPPKFGIMNGIKHGARVLPYSRNEFNTLMESRL